jgi:hypothetical protein
MKRLQALALAAGLATTSLAQASIFVTEPGSNGYNVETSIFNGSSFNITKITFDFTTSLTLDGSHVVIDALGPDTITAPSGGTASFSGSGAVFSFDFTSFGTGDVFKFAWDPDSAIDDEYGATGLDFIGAKITAVTSNGTYTGYFGQAGTTLDVYAVLSPSPVPEASTYAMTLAGLLTVGALARRRKAQ